MKALKIIGAIFALLVVGVGVAWYSLLVPPGAAAVCENVARVMKKETGVDMPAKERQACMRNATEAPSFGQAMWVKQLKCMRDASSGGDMKKCSSRG